MNVALFIAGGSGARLGIDVPKQYLEIEGKPIIVYGLTTFQNAECIDAIYVVCAEVWRKHVQHLKELYGLDKIKGIISGGSSRQESMYNGVIALSKELANDDIVIIMDANRPLVSKDIIERSIEEVRRSGSTLACDVCVDSMYVISGNRMIIGNYDRNQLIKGQTPEASQMSTLLDVFQHAREEGLQNQTMSDLMLRYGKPLAYVQGAGKNFKITTMEDLQLFRAFLLLKMNK